MAQLWGEFGVSAVPAPFPSDEEERQRTLDSYCVTDTDPEGRFDNITRLAAHFFGTSIALVSLIDHDRQWFKSRVGLDATETPRDFAFCAHAILSDAVLVVRDATQDPRFSGNPLVTDAPHIRFYAGAPLLADGRRLGTLCVIDDIPHMSFSPRDAETLTQLARLVVDELDLRREILRREQAEADLRERSRLLNMAEEVGEFGHWYTNFSTGERRWSDEVFRIIGLEPGSVTPSGELAMSVTHPDDQARMGAALKRAQETGEGFNIAIRLLRPDGSARDAMVRCMVDLGADGKPIGLFGVMQDVTDRRREEEELRSSRELLALTFQATRDGIWDWDLRADSIWFSPIWKEQLGYRDDELENSLDAWTDLILPEDRLAALAMADDYNTGRVPVFEMVQRFRHKNGHVVHILSRAIHVLDEHGKAIRMVGAHTDITREKQTEEALRLAKQTLSDAIEAIPEGFVYYDADDQLILCNSKYLDAHPRTAPIIRPGTPFETILRTAIANGEFGGAPSDDIELEDWIRGELERHRNPTLSFERQLADGRWILVAENKTASGALVGTRTDITERKRFEAELQRQAADMCALAEGLDSAREEADEQRLRAEEATRAKSDFLATMSHEIRTPMNGIMGMTELLFDTPLNEEQQQFAQAVRGSANALLTIINDILDFSKLEAGKVAIEALPFDPADVVEGVVELLAPRARERDIEVGFFVDPRLRRTLIGDPTRIRQILINLVGNAIKFTDHGTIAIELEALNVASDHLVMRLSVTDSGIGIPEDALPTLFNKFQQVDGSITRKYGGTGLGLAICRQLSEVMGGSISVESTLGQGSRFQVDVPLTLSGEEVAPSIRPLAGRRALVVDDLAINRRVLASMLDGLGATVTAVDSAMAALDALDRVTMAGQPFDVALIDQTMPVMDGGALLAAMAGQPALIHTKRVLVTSLGLGGRVDRGLADAVLTKPLRQAAVLSCLIGLFDPSTVVAAADSTGETSASDAAAPRAGHILLAEDNRTNQLFASTLLERLGYSVEVAEDGEQALAIASAGGLDLILMDVQMPVMDGLDAAQAIRQLDGPRARVPIIALTADAMSGAREECLAAGMDDYITKPINRAGLLAALDRWLAPTPEPQLPPPPGVAQNPDGDAGHGEALDESVLLSLEASVGADSLGLIVDSFLEDVAERLARLSVMNDAKEVGHLDLATLAGEAHDLSSMAGSFGGMAVMHLAWRLEVSCRHGEQEKAHALLPALVREAGRLEHSLRLRVSERA
jgi:PAS domain S-box-containing protein